MSSLDEQLALFEQEVMSAVTDDEAANAGVKAEQPIQAPEIGGSSAPGKTVKFVPHQLQHKPQPSFGTVSRFPPASALMPSSIIESGPTLYAPPPSASTQSSSKASMAKAAEASSSSSSSATNLGPGTIHTLMQQQQFKTLALPSDVELLLAKKQASKAHENSYLGAVLRGEKKMKRFVRSCGGQTWEDASMAEWDPNDFRIFCGDLGNEVSDELLAKAFRKYSSFQKAKVVRDSRTNKSKGFGFVSFRSQEDFIRAMKEMDGKYVGNRPIKLRKSNWKDRNAEVVKKKNKEKKKLGLI